MFSISTFMFSICLLKFSLSSSILPLSSLSILITIVLKTLHLVNCSPPFCLLLPLGTCFFDSPFWLPANVYFYVLGRAAMSPSLRVGLCSRCAVGLSGTVFHRLIVRTGHDQSRSCCAGNDPTEQDML